MDTLRSVECHVFFYLSNSIPRWRPVSVQRVAPHVLTRFLVFDLFFLSFLKVKSQYTSHIRSLPLKSGECRYFDVSSLNEERYGIVCYSAVTTYIPVTVTQVQTLLTGVEMLLKNLSKIIIILKLKSPLNQSDSCVVELV